MKALSFEQMEVISGGIKVDSLIGIMCGATLLFATSAILAPLAGATGTGCAVGLYTLHVWANQ